MIPFAYVEWVSIPLQMPVTLTLGNLMPLASWTPALVYRFTLRHPRIQVIKAKILRGGGGEFIIYF